MAPDFMKSGNSDRPFAPTPERPRLRWLTLLLVTLAAIYAGVKLYEVARPAKLPSATTPKTQTQPQATLPSLSVPVLPAPGTRVVTKCIVNGKTSYSDSACPAGSTAVQVLTKDNHNLMVGLTQEQMAAARSVQPSPPSATIVAQSNTSTPDTAGECKALDEYVKQLDSQARQPQTIQTQNWIRDERKKTRDRQFRIPCR